MPLIQGKSKKSFEHNLMAEKDAGKPMKQSLAIAYAVKKRNEKKGDMPKKMAEGGMVEEADEAIDHMAEYEKHMGIAMEHKAKAGNEFMPKDIDTPHDDFLSDEEQTPGPNSEYDENMQKKNILRRIMSK